LKAPKSVRAAEEFSRTRLSQSFFMRDFLFSEIAAIEGLSNLSDDPELAIAAGRGLCENLLEPLQATFGRIAIRSAYRSPEVNDFGCRHRLSCASNERNRARHTWDRRTKDGRMGALTTIVVPWLVDRMDTTSWEAMAWWIHDNLPYSELQFFPKLFAFNIGWHEAPKRTIYSFTRRKRRQFVDVARIVLNDDGRLEIRRDFLEALDRCHRSSGRPAACRRRKLTLTIGLT